MKLKKKNWKHLLYNILDDLNVFFQNGTLKAQTLEYTFGEMLITNMIETLYLADAEVVQQKAHTDAYFEVELEQWWNVNKYEYSNYSKYEAIARINIVNWIIKIFFGQYLKKYHSTASKIENITLNITVDEAIEILNEITNSCDFMNVFKNDIANNILSDVTWCEIKALNSTLSKIDVLELPSYTFKNLLDNSLQLARRKLAGQFSTPENLASLLIQLAMDNRKEHFIDPCCGTGTIAKAAYNFKIRKGISSPEALSTIWASDKYQFPLQITSIMLSDPSAMGELVQVFKSDVFDLPSINDIKFIDPSNNGQVVSRAFPKFQTIISNLPFVRFEDSSELNSKKYESIRSLSTIIGKEPVLSARADLYAYIIPFLFRLLLDNGTIGVIISNSWLGTDSGSDFRTLLLQLFKIRLVLISGNGRWFDNADVITTILVLEKRKSVISSLNSSESIVFATTMKRLSDWDNAYINNVNSSLRVKEIQCEMLIKNYLSLGEIEKKNSLGIGWNAFFVNSDWLNDINEILVKVESFFDIGRGERRGWDEMFYPNENHSIDPIFLKPVLISSKSLQSLVSSGNDIAFCCSLTEDDLVKKGYYGTIKWIKSFEYKVNKKGKFLKDVLKKKGHHWYEMRPDTLAIMAISMNPDKVLAVYKFDNPGSASLFL